MKFLTETYRNRLLELAGLPSVENNLRILIKRWNDRHTKKDNKVDLSWENDVLATLSPYRNDNIGENLLKSLTDTIIKNDMIWKPQVGHPEPFSSYEKNNFNTFIEFFTRKLSNKVFFKLKKESKECQLISPNECCIESIGKVANDLSTIFNLKKPTKDFLKNLNDQYDLNLKGYNFINMELLLSYYHKVHSPISGKIKNIITIKSPNKYFGNNMIWIVEFDTEKHGKVFLFLVGQSVVEDFEFKKHIGDTVEIFDEIGGFMWGSQTLIFYNDEFFDGEKPELSVDKHVFVGKKIF